MKNRQVRFSSEERRYDRKIRTELLLERTVKTTTTTTIIILLLSGKETKTNIKMIKQWTRYHMHFDCAFAIIKRQSRRIAGAADTVLFVSVCTITDV